jgi:hypothetical protein
MSARFTSHLYTYSRKTSWVNEAILMAHKGRIYILSLFYFIYFLSLSCNWSIINNLWIDGWEILLCKKFSFTKQYRVYITASLRTAWQGTSCFCLRYIQWDLNIYVARYTDSEDTVRCEHICFQFLIACCLQWLYVCKIALQSAFQIAFSSRGTWEEWN